MPVKDRTRQRRVPTTRSAQATLDALLDSAERVLAAEGFQGMTMERIARGAQVGKATSYHYFASKEALAQQVATRMWHRLSAVVAQRYAETVGSGFLLTIRAVVDSAFDFAAQHRALLGRWYQGAPHLGSPALQDPVMNDLLAAFGATLSEKGSAFGTTNGPLAARVILSALGGLLQIVARDRPEDFDDPAFRAETHKLVLRYLGGAGALEAEEPT